MGIGRLWKYPLSILSAVELLLVTASMTPVPCLSVVRDPLCGGSDGMLAYCISFCPVYQILVLSSNSQTFLGGSIFTVFQSRSIC